MKPNALIVAGFLVVWQGLTGPSSAQQKPPAPGKMVDIGGYSLYLNCSGEGAPAVILEYGLGDVSSVWSLVQRQVAKSVQVCSYDRAYDGFSDGGPVPSTLHQQVFELHLLLKAMKIKPPYVLVGQSVGGLLNQLYKSVYPDEVAGIVLVDSTHLDSRMGPTPLRSNAKGTRVPPPRTMAEARPPALTKTEQENLNIALTRLGQETAGALAPPFDKLPLDVQPIYRWEHSHPKMPPGGEPQVNWWAEEMQQMFVDRQGKEHIYGDMPLMVLAANRATTDQERLRQVNDMVLMSTNSLLIVDTGGDHDLHLTAPGLVAWSIQEVVEAVRSHGRVDGLKPR